jgi:hypothetical protein
MKSVILFIEVALPSIILGIITLILVISMGCKEAEIVHATPLETTKMLTLEEVNKELELDICDMQKLEAIPHTEPEQFIITFRR